MKISCEVISLKFDKVFEFVLQKAMLDALSENENNPLRKVRFEAYSEILMELLDGAFSVEQIIKAIGKTNEDTFFEIFSQGILDREMGPYTQLFLKNLKRIKKREEKLCVT